LIDDEARHIIEEMYNRAKAILVRRRPELERIAAELIRKETLDRSELDLLLSSSPLATIAPAGNSSVGS
jgi:cell division protease FtsH